MFLCSQWIQSIQEALGARPVYIAVGNKIDFAGRTVSFEEAESYFARSSTPVRYFEASAKTGEGVKELFEEAVKLWLKRGEQFCPNSNQLIEENRKSQGGRQTKSKGHDDCVIC